MVAQQPVYLFLEEVTLTLLCGWVVVVVVVLAVGVVMVVVECC